LTSGSCSWVNARRVSFDKTSFTFFFMVLDLHRAATIVIDCAVIQEIEIREEKMTGSSARTVLGRSRARLAIEGMKDGSQGFAIELGFALKGRYLISLVL
jgi:hypothetical protein